MKDVICDLGKQIVTDPNVTNATQQFLSAAVSGGVQIVGAAGSTLVATGSIGATISSAGTAASSALGTVGTAAANVGHAVMSTKIVSTTTAVLTSPVVPWVIGAAIVGGLLWWLCED